MWAANAMKTTQEVDTKKQRPSLRGAVREYNLNDYFTEALAVLYGTKVARLAAVKATPPIVQFSKVIVATASTS
jgi:hypothetical protein